MFCVHACTLHSNHRRKFVLCTSPVCPRPGRSLTRRPSASPSSCSIAMDSTAPPRRRLPRTTSWFVHENSPQCQSSKYCHKMDSDMDMFLELASRGANTCMCCRLCSGSSLSHALPPNPSTSPRASVARVPSGFALRCVLSPRPSSLRQRSRPLPLASR